MDTVKPGFVSPDKEVFVKDESDYTHAALAGEILKSNPELNSQSSNSKYLQFDEPGVRLLLDNGYLRVGRDWGIRAWIFETSNYSLLRDVLSEMFHWQGLRGRIIVDVNGKEFDGDVSEFLERSVPLQKYSSFRKTPFMLRIEK